MHGCESVWKPLLENSLQLRQRQLGWHGPACVNYIWPLLLWSLPLQQVNLQGLIANMNGLYIGAPEGLQCFAQRALCAAGPFILFVQQGVLVQDGYETPLFEGSARVLRRSGLKAEAALWQRVTC